MEVFDIAAKYGPYVIPVLLSILVIVFTKNYVYKGMVPEDMLSKQIDREKAMIKEQSDLEQKRVKEQSDLFQQILTMAKDLEQNLEEIVFQLQSLTTKVSEEIGENNERITGLERFLSDQLDVIRDHSKTIQHLAFQCEKHRKNIPDTEVMRKERNT